MPAWGSGLSRPSSLASFWMGAVQGTVRYLMAKTLQRQSRQKVGHPWKTCHPYECKS